MAVTVSADAAQLVGTKRRVKGTITFDSSYPTGGEAITLASLGLTMLEELEVRPGRRSTSSGFTPVWDRSVTSPKVQVLAPIGSYFPGSPAVGATTAVHAAVTDNGAQQVVTTGITNPAVLRNVTATSGGTAADIKAIQVIVAGTNIDDAAITETLPVFTENSATTVVGSKAFKTVTSITIPAHDGTGATTAIGTGAKLGLPLAFARDGVLAAHFGGVREATRPTVVVDDNEVEKNLITLNSTLDGSAVIVDFYTSGESRQHEVANATDLSAFVCSFEAVGY